jgi:L-ribulokinase
VAGIGVDFTASTVLPAAADGTPLALRAELADEPHAYVKLWKHHAAEPFSQAINAAQPSFLKYYGGKTSAEWSLAKAWQVLEEAPAIWDAADRWIEAGDWLIWQLTGQEARSACQAGYKAHWHPEWGGYPDPIELERLRPGLSGWLRKLAPPHPVGAKAGGLTRAWAEQTGLREGTPVAVAVIDAHAAVPGVGVRRPGVLTMVLGTSSCHLAVGEAAVAAEGIAGVVPDGILPGSVGYEAGQAASGDMLAWWVETLAWASGAPESQVFARLANEASRHTGSSGLVALDWWNGCRTPLMDASLTGVLTGLTLSATPPTVYKGLLEATAYGTRLIVETLEAAIGTIEEVRATGGMSGVPFIMQLYADVLGRELRASDSPHASARGAALYGAMAAGVEVDPPQDFRTYVPQDTARYEAPYARYRELFAWFSGPGRAPVPHSDAQS